MGLPNHGLGRPMVYPPPCSLQSFTPVSKAQLVLQQPAQAAKSTDRGVGHADRVLQVVRGTGRVQVDPPPYRLVRLGETGGQALHSLFRHCPDPGEISWLERAWRACRSMPPPSCVLMQLKGGLHVLNLSGKGAGLKERADGLHGP